MTGTGDRILVVSPYPPLRDGIGAYAVQQVQALRREGHDVEVCSPVPSAAHHHLDLKGPKGARALGRLMRGYDRVIVHFHPDVFYVDPSTPTTRLSTGWALARAFRAGPPVEIRLHEVDRRWASADGQVEASTHGSFAARQLFEASARASRAVFQAAAEVTVHVPEHTQMMVEDFGVDPGKVRLVDHGGDFAVRVPDDQAAARESLGLARDGHVFVCIGFIQPHKGFDRAATAFRGLGERGASLHIVGSVRVDDAEALSHQRELEALEAQVPGVELHLGYVSDEAFDRWIVAADTVVLPYRHIWSSSVAERARLYGRPVIATRVGGLATQIGDHADNVVVDDNAGLTVAMADAVGGRADAETSAPAWDFEGTPDRGEIMAEIHRRAAAQRGIKVKVTEAKRPKRAPTADQVAAPLRRLRTLPPPTPTSARPGVSGMKRMIRRLVAWEVDPLREQVANLQKAATQAAETTDARLDELSEE